MSTERLAGDREGRYRRRRRRSHNQARPTAPLLGDPPIRSDLDDLPTSGAVICLCGPIASGKSTLATTRWPDSHIDVAAIRLQLGPLADASTVGRGFTLAYRQAERRIREGKLAVIDSTGVTQPVRLSAQLIAQRFKVPAHIVVVDTPLELCLARNACRPDERRVPEDVARSIFALFLTACDEVRRELWSSIVVADGIG